MMQQLKVEVMTSVKITQVVATSFSDMILAEVSRCVDER
jgi:hypothetical protein